VGATPSVDRAEAEGRMSALDRRTYALAELRAALRRAQLVVDEITTAGIALKANMIGPDEALAWLADAPFEALDFDVPTPPDRGAA
jgi:hypothetical protein